MYQGRRFTAASNRSSSGELFPLKYNNDGKVKDYFSIAAWNNDVITFRGRTQTYIVLSALDELTKMNQTTTTDEVGSQARHTFMEASILELEALKSIYLLDDDEDENQDKIFQQDFVPLKDMHDDDDDDEDDDDDDDDDDDEGTRSWPYDERFSTLENEYDVDVDVDAVAFKLEVNAWKDLNIDLDDAGKYLRDLILSNVSMLVELLETFTTTELDQCIFRKAIKIEINTLKNLYLKHTTVHHCSNSAAGCTTEKSSLNEKSTICDDNDAATYSTNYSSIFSSLNSFVSTSLLISRKKKKISDEKWFHRFFGWLTMRIESKTSSRKKEWLRAVQGPVQNGSAMEMVFYDNTESNLYSF